MHYKYNNNGTILYVDEKKYRVYYRKQHAKKYLKIIKKNNIPFFDNIKKENKETKGKKKSKRCKTKNKENKENKKNILDINNPEHIDYFYNKKNKREKNDCINKYREKFLCEILNNQNFHKEFENTDYKKKFTKLSHKFKREISKLYDKTYTKIICEKKAGRKNYDFDIKFYNNEELVKTCKVEFKYGVSTITKYPEIYSKYIKNFKVFKDKNKCYHKYYFNNIENFINTFPEDIKSELKKCRPNSFIEYCKIMNDTKYKHPYQKTIYEYSNENTKRNIPFKKFINQQISDFLQSVTIDDIDIENINKKIYETQKNKVFLLCKNGEFTTEIINDLIIMKKDNFKIINGNTLVFDCTEEKYQLQWLLRWKNHKGCSGPSWQIKLYKKK